MSDKILDIHPNSVFKLTEGTTTHEIDAPGVQVNVYDDGAVVVSEKSSITIVTEDSFNATPSGSGAVIHVNEVGLVSAERAESAAASADQAVSNASAAENKAHLWAEEDEDVPVEPGEYSSKHHKIKAQSFRDEAEIHYNNTVGVETNVSNIAANITTIESNVEAAEDNVEAINIQVNDHATDIGLTKNEIDIIKIDIDAAKSAAVIAKIEAEAAFTNITDIQQFNGFELTNELSNGDISFDPVTRTVTLDVKAGEASYHFWVDGDKITNTTPLFVSIPDVTGAYIVYIDTAGVMQYVATPSMTPDVFHKYALVAHVYWNAATQDKLFSNERHGMLMDSMTHARFHNTVGAVIEKGSLGIVGLASGSSTYTQINSGAIWDEDIRHAIPLSASHPFMYRAGADGAWVHTPADNKLGFVQGGDTNISFNEYTGTTWQLTECANNQYSMVVFLAVGDVDHSIFKVIGQHTHGNLNNARDSIQEDIVALVTDGLPVPEYVFLYAAIINSSGELQELADGSLYADLRKVAGLSTGSGSGGGGLAADIPTDITNFTGVLSNADTDIQAALDTLDDHLHDGRYYTETETDSLLTGKEPTFTKNTAFNKDFGSTAGTVTEGNDSRLSDARTPVAHNHVESDVTDLDKYTQAETDALLDDKYDKTGGTITGTVTVRGTVPSVTLFEDDDNAVGRMIMSAGYCYVQAGASGVGGTAPSSGNIRFAGYQNANLNSLTVQYGGVWEDILHTGIFDPADKLDISSIDNVPVNGVLDVPISSNWAYDHQNNNSAHSPEYLTDADDVDSLPDGWYKWNGASVPANAPSNYGILVQWGEAQPNQMFFGGTDSGQVYVRRKDSGVWYSWTKMATEDFVNSGLLGKLDVGAQAYDSDRLDGVHASALDTPDTIARRNGNGDIYARLFRSTYQEGTINAAHQVAFRVNDGPDDYIRFASPASFKDNYLTPYFLRSDQSDTINGALTINADGTNLLNINKTSDTNYGGLAFQVGGLNNWLLYTVNNSSGDMYLQSRNYDTDGSFKATIYRIDWASGYMNFYQTPKVNDVDIATVDDTVNDADNLGGVAAANYLRSDIADEAAGNITFNGGLTVGTGQAITSNADQTYDKIRVWNNENSAIGMRDALSYGYLNDYAMTFTMGNIPNRGFLWRHKDHATSEGAMSLTTDGRLTVDKRVATPEVQYGGPLGLVKSFGKAFTLPSYFTDGEYLEIARITPISASRNYVIAGEVALQVSAVSEVIQFEWTVRSDTLPSVSQTLRWYKTDDRGYNVEVVTWVDDINGVLVLALKKTGGGDVQTVSASFKAYYRSDDSLEDIDVSNVGELTAIPAGFTETTYTDGAFISGNLEVDQSITVPTIDVTGNIIVSGTVDGRDIAADGATLDTHGHGGDEISIPELNGLAAGATDVEAALELLDNHDHGAISFPPSFSYVSVSGEETISADSTTDTLNIAAGTGITITTNATTDTVTIAGSGGGGDYLPLSGGALAGDVTFNDGVSAYFGTANDLRIYFNGYHSYFYNYTGDMHIRNLSDGRNIYFQANDAGGVDRDMVYMDPDSTTAGINLFCRGTSRLRTTDTGVDVDGGLTVDGDVDITAGNSLVFPVGVKADKIKLWGVYPWTIGVDATYTYGSINGFAMTFTVNADSELDNWGWLWRTAGHTTTEGAMSLDANGNLTVDSNVTSPKLTAEGATAGYLWVGQTVANNYGGIIVDEDDTYIVSGAPGSGQGAGGGNIKFSGIGLTNLNSFQVLYNSTFKDIWHAGNHGSGSGLDADTVDGVHASSFVRSDADDFKSGHLHFGDNAYAYFGTGYDLQLVHDGVNSYAQNTNGHFYLRNLAHGSNMYLQCFDASGNWRPGIYILPDSTSSGVILYCRGTPRLYTTTSGINCNGVVQANGVTLTSDERAKDFDELPDCDWIYELVPRAYRWKDEDKDNKLHLGFSAQDTHKKLPDTGMGVVSIPEDSEEMWTMAPTELIAPMVKCIQEQKQEIEQLKEMVKCLIDGQPQMKQSLSKESQMGISYIMSKIRQIIQKLKTMWTT